MNSNFVLNQTGIIDQTRVKPTSFVAQRELKKEKIKQKRANIEKSIEVSLKIFANLGISFLACFSIKQLLPYHLEQQAKIAEINAEIAKIEPRVEKLKENFTTTFDPKLTRKVMEKNTYKVDPNVSPIFFIKK